VLDRIRRVEPDIPVIITSGHDSNATRPCSRACAPTTISKAVHRRKSRPVGQECPRSTGIGSTMSHKPCRRDSFPDMAIPSRQVRIAVRNRI
jgi:hypothetical protein